MADQNVAIALIALAAIVSYGVFQAYPQAARRYFYGPLERGRVLGALVIGAVLVWTWMRSGVPLLMVTAIIIVAFGTIFVLVEEPHRDIR